MKQQKFIGTAQTTSSVVKQVADKKLASHNMAMIYSKKPSNAPSAVVHNGGV